ncbi:hypothetical protein N7517_010026 [Penicillium concentricum]|uniref:Hemerythrin-like domain-containing protein n=1 Tax=Penicillium concentricum TaxID=293559 RepID=A0A9W9UZF9_9EURO|nr:uncharacterized protein N7517_010026 [Penicillium concentricum]KAJ5360835.1 hypothetical protein N7517_010026 [Penicillium concentricum]
MLRRVLTIHPPVPKLQMTTARPKAESPKPLFSGNIPALQTYTEDISTPTVHSRILPAIKHDHCELESHSHKILSSTNPDQQTRFQNQFVWELARHLIGEELVVYPAMITSLPDGQGLKTFQELSSTDPRFLPTLKGLMRDLGIHARHEEDVDLPRLEELLSKDESVELTKSLDRVKIFIPSRAHPLAPTEPFFETAVGLLTAPIDMLADLFRKWPDGRDKEKK